ncbi:41188_t:CDS:2, partial [Gigaspora margarita]
RTEILELLLLLPKYKGSRSVPRFFQNLNKEICYNQTPALPQAQSLKPDITTSRKLSGKALSKKCISDQ